MTPHTTQAMAISIERAAERLRQAQDTLTPCAPVRDLIAPDDLVTAYAVQDINVAYGCRQGRRPVGRKIALSSKAIQDKLKVRHPTYGQLFADMCVAEGVDIDFGALIQPRIETEIALVMETSLDLEQPTVVDVINAVAYALPAFEIVGSRIAGWDVSAADFVADNSAGSHFVLGSRPRMLSEFDILDCPMTTTRRGETVSTGSGRACLGNPLNAMVWLAGTLARAGRPLRPGEVVMTGSLGPMVPIAAGDAFEAQIDGLGRIAVRFGTN